MSESAACREEWLSRIRRCKCCCMFAYFPNALAKSLPHVIRESGDASGERERGREVGRDEDTLPVPKREMG